VDFEVWEAGQCNRVFLPGSKTIVTFFRPDLAPPVDVKVEF